MSFFSFAEKEIRLLFQSFILILSLYILQDLVFTYIDNSSIEFSSLLMSKLETIAFSCFLVLISWCLIYLASILSDTEIIHKRIINSIFITVLTVSMILLQFDVTVAPAVFVLILLFCCNVFFLIIRVIKNVKISPLLRIIFAGALFILVWAVLEDFVLAFFPDLEVYPIVNIVLNAFIILFFKSQIPLEPGQQRPVISLSEWFGEYGLTLREQEIAILLAKGNDKPGIASLLNISDHTVKTHIIHIYEKCGINSKYKLISRIFRETDFTA